MANSAVSPSPTGLSVMSLSYISMLPLDAASMIATATTVPQDAVAVTNVTACVFSLKDSNGFASGNPTGAAGMVFDDKTGKRLAHDQANIDRGTGMGARHTARTVKDNNMVWILQNDISRP